METMKLTEKDLMVGDYVYSTFSDKPCKVQAIELSEHGYGSVRVSGVDGVKDIVSLSPIPLTAEVLKKNGLKPHRRYMGMFVERTDKYQLYVNKSQITAYILLEDGTEEHQWVLPRPMYVHEFQHAVKDFKIEKNILL